MAGQPKVEKYREWALKSGFPFENETLQIINKCVPTSSVIRNVEFETLNEERRPTIRSIDFAVSVSKDLRNIPASGWGRGQKEIAEVNFIVDCKYSSDESFLFTPSTRPILRSERSWPHLVPMLIKNNFGDDVKLHRKDLVNLAKIAEHIPIGGMGRKVKEQSRERDSVASAMIQVFQGLHEFIETKARTLGSTTTTDSNYGRNAYFFVPMIVTNAPLLLLKDQITPSDVEKAAKKDEFLSAVDAILVEMPDVFDVKEAWSRLKGVLSSSRKNLGWNEQGITDGTILFCNPIGLESFVKSFISEFDKLPTEATT